MQKRSQSFTCLSYFILPFGMVLGFGIEPNHTHQRPGYGGRGRGRTPAPIPNRRGGYCRRHPAEEACGSPKGQRLPCYYYTIFYRIVPRKPVFLPNLFRILFRKPDHSGGRHQAPERRLLGVAAKEPGVCLRDGRPSSREKNLWHDSPHTM